MLGIGFDFLQNTFIELIKLYDLEHILNLRGQFRINYFFRFAPILNEILISYVKSHKNTIGIEFLMIAPVVFEI